MEQPSTWACNDAVEPLCQQYEATNHQKVRDNRVFKGYHEPGVGWATVPSRYAQSDEPFHSFAQTDADEVPCDPAININQKELNIEMELFSRNFNMKHYSTAWDIYNKLVKSKKKAVFPRISSNSLYGTAY